VAVPQFSESDVCAGRMEGSGSAAVPWMGKLFRMEAKCNLFLLWRVLV
jgi:hypothetical protein